MDRLRNAGCIGCLYKEVEEMPSHAPALGRPVGIALKLSSSCQTTSCVPVASSEHPCHREGSDQRTRTRRPIMYMLQPKLVKRMTL